MENSKKISHEGSVAVQNDPSFASFDTMSVSNLWRMCSVRKTAKQLTTIPLFLRTITYQRIAIA